MSEYKRNQIEEAISRISEERAAAPSSALRTRLKRLLEMDRSLGRNRRSADPEKANYAFFSGDSPGRGVEVSFSDYEAFALLIALRLLGHGWPQSFPVLILRRIRPELEKAHLRILKQDPAVLFDEKQVPQNVRAGDPYVNNTDSVFMVIASDKPLKERDRTQMSICSVCRGLKEVYRFVNQKKAQSWTMLEVAGSAHSLAHHLQNSPPRKRGRGN
jgi:hypothetical protein